MRCLCQAFDTVNIHTLIDKLTQTNIPHTILRYIANYIKGRMAYTTFRNHTSTKRQFKSGVLQGGVLSPILFNIYTSDIPLPPDSVQLTTYADDITNTAPHTDINIAKANIQPYLQDVLKWTKDNDLLLNTDKTTCTLFSVEVFKCWLNLAASYLDNENEIPLKVIASFSAVHFVMPSMYLIVLHSLLRSIFWSMVSTKSIHFCRLCTQMRFWISLINIGSSGEVVSPGHHGIWYLCWYRFRVESVASSRDVVRCCFE